ncbi:MAG: hypothetical protein AAF849_22835 [Bacteroidota bacterium]
MELKRIVRFLEKEGWKEHKSNGKYTFYQPPSGLGLKDDFYLPVPILVGATDFTLRLSDTKASLAGIYETEEQALFYDVGNYMDILKKDAMYFKLSSNEVMYRNTLEVDYISSFLKNLTASYSSYIKIKFSKAFNSLFKNDAVTVKMANRVASLSRLRIVDLSFQSFAFGVSADTIMGNEKIEISEVVDWRKSAVNQYKREVIEIDYTSKEDVDYLLELFSNNERKLIFDPLIKVINNNDYEVAITNSKFQKRKVYRRIPKSTVQVIVPKEEKNGDSAIIELMQVVVPVDKSKPKLTIRTEDIQDDLFSKPIEETEGSITHLKLAEEMIVLKSPIKIKVKYNKEQKEFEAIYDPLDYRRTADDYKKIQSLFIQDFQRFLDRYQHIKENSIATLSPQDQLILSVFEQLV